MSNLVTKSRLNYFATKLWNNKIKPIKTDLANHGHNILNNKGNVTCQTGTTQITGNPGISMSTTYNNGFPIAYGNVLNLKGSGEGQILVGWPGSSGHHEGVFIRSRRDTPDSKWCDWAQLFTTAHKPSWDDVNNKPDVFRHKGDVNHGADWNWLGGNGVWSAVEFNHSSTPPGAYKYGCLMQVDTSGGPKSQMYFSHGGNEIWHRGGWDGILNDNWSRVVSIDINNNRIYNLNLNLDVPSGHERYFKFIGPGMNHGFYGNGYGTGIYDWERNRKVFAYEIPEDRLVTYRFFRAAGGIQYSLENSTFSKDIDLSKEPARILTESDKNIYSIDKYDILETKEGLFVTNQMNTLEVNENSNVLLETKLDEFYATIVYEIKRLKEELNAIKSK